MRITTHLGHVVTGEGLRPLSEIRKEFDMPPTLSQKIRERLQNQITSIKRITSSITHLDTTLGCAGIHHVTKTASIEKSTGRDLGLSSGLSANDQQLQPVPSGRRRPWPSRTGATVCSRGLAATPAASREADGPPYCGLVSPAPLTRAERSCARPWLHLSLSTDPTPLSSNLFRGSGGHMGRRVVPRTSPNTDFCKLVRKRE